MKTTDEVTPLQEERELAALEGNRCLIRETPERNKTALLKSLAQNAKSTAIEPENLCVCAPAIGE